MQGLSASLREPGVGGKRAAWTLHLHWVNSRDAARTRVRALCTAASNAGGEGEDCPGHE